MRFQAFIPRSESPFVFALAMACYAYFFSGIVNAVIRTFHRSLHPVSLLPDWLYWFTIVIDALLIAIVLEVLRWLRVSKVVQVIIASLLLSATRAFSDPLWSLLLLPIFAMCAVSYVYWRPRGLVRAFCVVLLVEVFYDIVPAFRAFFPAVPNA